MEETTRVRASGNAGARSRGINKPTQESISWRIYKKTVVEVEKLNTSRTDVHVTFDHNINRAWLEMVADIIVNDIRNITGNIIIDITITITITITIIIISIQQDTKTISEYKGIRQ